MKKEHEKLLMMDLGMRITTGVKIWDKWKECPKKLSTGHGTSVHWIGLKTTVNKELKPILFPLSMLTKEITINGRSFVLAKALWSLSAKEEEDFDVYGVVPDYWKTGISYTPNRIDHKHVKMMLENHFDIHGLIPLGLAMDATTVKCYE